MDKILFLGERDLKMRKVQFRIPFLSPPDRKSRRRISVAPPFLEAPENYIDDASAAAGEAEVSAAIAESVASAAGAISELAAVSSVVAAGFEQAATDRAATAAAATRAVRTILEVMDPNPCSKTRASGSEPYAHIALIPKTPESRKGLFHEPVIAKPRFSQIFAAYDEIRPQMR
jgi:hypothetical protein